MTTLILGLVIFLGIHSTQIVASNARTALIGRIGEMPYKAVYALVSIIGFWLIVVGYGEARAVGTPQLWYPPVWTRHLAYLLMLPVFTMLIAVYFPGRISRALKHPMLVAVKTWAFAHLISNGDLASVLLFGAFLAWAVADRISVKRRSGGSSPPHAPENRLNDVVALAGGLALYIAFVLWLHPLLIGVPIWPM